MSPESIRPLFVNNTLFGIQFFLWLTYTERVLDEKSEQVIL